MAPVRYLAALLLASVLALAACAPASPPAESDFTAAEAHNAGLAKDLTLSPQSAASELERNRAVCAGLNGTYQPGGRAGYLRCILTFSDAGKACSDGTDCKGDCLARTGEDEPGPSPGVCQATTSQFGCFSKVEHGQAVGGICID